MVQAMTKHAANVLTAIKVRTAGPGKHHDGGSLGLYLRVKSSVCFMRLNQTPRVTSIASFSTELALCVDRNSRPGLFNALYMKVYRAR